MDVEMKWDFLAGMALFLILSCFLWIDWGDVMCEEDEVRVSDDGSDNGDGGTCLYLSW